MRVPGNPGSGGITAAAVKPLDFKDLLPLIGVVVGGVLGFALAEVGQWMRGRREDRKGVGKALADLLEIRTQLMAVPLAIRELSKRLQLPPEAQTLVGHVLASWTQPELLSKRFDEAVTCVAGVDPVLAFRMRSRDVGGAVMGRIRALSLNDPAAASLWPQVEAKFVDQGVSALNDLILDVARAHGLRTWWRVRKRLRTPVEPDSEALDSIVNVVMEAVRSAAKKQQEEKNPAAAGANQ